MLELFRLQEALPPAKNVLQRAERGGEAGRKLTRLTRRRLVKEKVPGGDPEDFLFET